MGVSVQTSELTRVFKVEKKGKGFLGRIRRKKKHIVAADHINISINKGELFGLVGPNGARAMQELNLKVVLPFSVSTKRREGTSP